VDLNARNEAVEHGDETREDGDVLIVQCVRQPMQLAGMKTRVGKDDLHRVVRGGVAVQCRLDVSFDAG
jgi:hypothetical protein